MRSWLVLPLAGAAFFGCAEAQDPAGPPAGGPDAPAAEAATDAATDPIELADGRRAPPWEDVSAWAARPAVQQAIAAAGTYWRGQDPAFEEEVRVMAVAEGAFTEAGAAQQAVLVLLSPWPRGEPKMGLAVVEGDRLVRNVAFAGNAQTLAAVPDLDGDGRAELAYTGEFGMGGQTSRSLVLVAFGPGGLAERGGTAIYDSDCDTARPGAGSTAARVLARPGPAFTVERYTQAACERDVWAPAGGPAPLTLDAYGGAYVDLPVR